MHSAFFHWAYDETFSAGSREAWRTWPRPACWVSSLVGVSRIRTRLRDVLQFGGGRVKRWANGHQQSRRGVDSPSSRSHDLGRRIGFSLRPEARPGTELRRGFFPAVSSSEKWADTLPRPCPAGRGWRQLQPLTTGGQNTTKRSKPALQRARVHKLHIP
jgi:hypothetical protein